MAAQSFEAALRQKITTARNACVEHGRSLLSRVRHLSRPSAHPSPRLEAQAGAPAPSPATAREQSAHSSSDLAELGTLELLGESLHVSKERVSAGEVIIRKEVITETQLIEVPVRREELVIERHTPEGEIQRLSNANGRELRIVLSEERPQFQTRPVVRDLVRVSRRKVWEKRAVSELLRHEELRVEDVQTPQDDTPERAA